MTKLALLLHGRGNQPNGDKSAFFPDLQKHLESQWCKVLAPHLPYADWWTYEQTIEFLEDLLWQEQYDELNIIWHSSWGYLACYLASHHKVRKLVLIAPTCPLSCFSDKLQQLIQSWFDKDWVSAYQSFHNHSLDIQKIVSHSSSIQFRFWAQDPYIDSEIRQRYAKEFALAPSLSFNVLPDRGHMGVDEGVTRLEEIYWYL